MVSSYAEMPDSILTHFQKLLLVYSLQQASLFIIGTKRHLPHMLHISANICSAYAVLWLLLHTILRKITGTKCMA